MTTAIEARSLTLRYGEVTAVDDLSFQLEAGRIHGLLGRNGSGKSSLLSVVGGFRRPSVGELLIDGEPGFENHHATARTCLIRESCDTVENNWPDDRVRDALRFAAGTRQFWDAGYADKLVDRFRLPSKTRIGQLSRGQRSALGVVLGLASRAPLTMFDESYLGMDAPSRYAFYDELLADFMAHPRTIVVSTHLIEEVSSLFDTVLIIDHGRLLMHEEAERLRSLGVTVVGPSDAVDRYAEGMTVLGEKSLGPTKSLTVYGELDDARRAAAHEAGLEIGTIPIQDLFVHLTDESGGSR